MATSERCLRIGRLTLRLEEFGNSNFKVVSILIYFEEFKSLQKIS